MLPSPRIQAHRVRAAFSLLELLIALAIIAVLVALGFSVLGKARQQGANVRCISNLRQIAVAFSRCAGENGGVLNFQRYNVKGAPTTLRWNDFLIRGGYLDAADAFVRCPAVDPSLSKGGGYVYGGIGEVTATDPHSRQIENQPASRAIHLLTVAEPAKYWLLADTWSTQHGNQIYIVNPLASSVWRVQMRHSGRANVLFADGHVAALDLPAMQNLAINPLINAYNAEGQPIR